MQLVTLAGSGAEGHVAARLGAGEYVDLVSFANPECLEVWVPKTLRGVLDGGPDALALVAEMISRA